MFYKRRNVRLLTLYLFLPIHIACGNTHDPNGSLRHVFFFFWLRTALLKEKMFTSDFLAYRDQLFLSYAP